MRTGFKAVVFLLFLYSLPYAARKFRKNNATSARIIRKEKIAEMKMEEQCRELGEKVTVSQRRQLTKRLRRRSRRHAVNLADGYDDDDKFDDDADCVFVPDDPLLKESAENGIFKDDDGLEKSLYFHEYGMGLKRIGEGNGQASGWERTMKKAKGNQGRRGLNEWEEKRFEEGHEVQTITEHVETAQLEDKRAKNSLTSAMIVGGTACILIFSLLAIWFAMWQYSKSNQNDDDDDDGSTREERAEVKNVRKSERPSDIL